jgi:hypothetical protein
MRLLCSRVWVACWFMRAIYSNACTISCGIAGLAEAAIR